MPQAGKWLGGEYRSHWILECFIGRDHLFAWEKEAEEFIEPQEWISVIFDSLVWQKEWMDV